MGHLRTLFHLFSSFQTTLQFLQQINVKNVHPVYGAEIRTHNLRTWVSSHNQQTRAPHSIHYSIEFMRDRCKVSCCQGQQQNLFQNQYQNFISIYWLRKWSFLKVNNFAKNKMPTLHHNFGGVSILTLHIIEHIETINGPFYKTFWRKSVNLDFFHSQMF